MPPKSPLEHHADHDNQSNKLQLRWSRFKTKPHNLNSFGLVSRGDTALQKSAEARAQYFDEIISSFKPASVDAIESSLAQISPEISQTLRKLRTLREALLKHKPDNFTKGVFLFSIRVGATVGHYQTYVASIMYLLNTACDLLTESEKLEIIGLLILHVSHCNHDNSRALRLFHENLSPSQDMLLYKVLLAWVNQDYYTWLRIYNNENDPAIYAIMSLGVEKMMSHMIECMSSSYFTYPKGSIKDTIPRGISWNDFKELYAVKWTEKDGTITIRSRGAAGTKL